MAAAIESPRTRRTGPWDAQVGAQEGEKPRAPLACHRLSVVSSRFCLPRSLESRARPRGGLCSLPARVQHWEPAAAALWVPLAKRRVAIM